MPAIEVPFFGRVVGHTATPYKEFTDGQGKTQPGGVTHVLFITDEADSLSGVWNGKCSEDLALLAEAAGVGAVVEGRRRIDAITRGQHKTPDMAIRVLELRVVTEAAPSANGRTPAKV